MTETAAWEARFIAAERYRAHRYAANHPLAIPRVSLTLDLINSYGALSEAEYLVSRQASDEELAWFHTPDYIAAMRAAQAAGKVSQAQRQRHNIGNLENPYFNDFFVTPATATGGSIQAAEQVLAGRVAFSPAGGMHHARPDQARGFCFFNDPVLAVMRLRRHGWRVLYLDIDAHHGDGVEQAFAGDDQVLTFSLHMDTGYAYPFQGGGWRDWGPLGNALNVPLPRHTHDGEYRWVFERLWPRVLAAFCPDAVVLQAGTDILAPDPLGKFRISTGFFLELVARVLAEAPRHGNGAPRLAVLGGGGYHPLMLARCWTGVWALLSGRSLPAELPEAGARLLRAVGWDDDEDEAYYPKLFRSRLEPACEGPLRPELQHQVENLLAQHPLWRRAA